MRIFLSLPEQCAKYYFCICMENEYGEIPTRLVPAILATVFCCLPFGIMAVYHSSQTESALLAGNRRAAAESSQAAKNWILVSLFAGLSVYAIGLIVWICAALALSTLD